MARIFKKVVSDNQAEVTRIFRGIRTEHGLHPPLLFESGQSAEETIFTEVNIVPLSIAPSAIPPAGL